MKKNLKSFTLIFITATSLVLSLTACGSKNSSSADASGAAGSSEIAESTSAAGTGSEAYDASDFTVNVPGNYFVLTLPDYSADANENGNQPACTDAIGLIRDGENELDSYDKPTMYIYYYEDTTAEDESDAASRIYSDLKEFDYSVNDTDCIAMEGTLNSGASDDNPYEYYLIYIPINENDCITVILPKSVNGLSLDPEAEDVKAIIESVTLK